MGTPTTCHGLRTAAAAAPMQALIKHLVLIKIDDSIY